LQVRQLEVGPREVRPLRLHARQVGAEQVRLGEVHAAQIGPLEVSALQVGVAEPGVAEVESPQVQPAQRTPPGDLLEDFLTGKFSHDLPWIKAPSPGSSQKYRVRVLERQIAGRGGIIGPRRRVSGGSFLREESNHGDTEDTEGFSRRAYSRPSVRLPCVRLRELRASVVICPFVPREERIQAFRRQGTVACFADWWADRAPGFVYPSPFASPSPVGITEGG